MNSVFRIVCGSEPGYFENRVTQVINELEAQNFSTIEIDWDVREDPCSHLFHFFAYIIGWGD